MSSAPDNPQTPWLRPNTVTGTLIVASVLCLACSLLVSATAVLLRPTIDHNRDLRKQRNVLIAAGLFDEDLNSDDDVPALFEKIETVYVNLPRQRDAADDDAAGEINSAVSADSYDPRKAAKDPQEQIAIPAELDTAGIKNREPIAPVYLVKDDQGKVVQFVLPVYGKGLWSTLYGFLALEADVSAGLPVKGITFYEHAETPGLGGEVDNPGWKAKWPRKELFSTDGSPMLDITRPGAATASNQVDGLSGATITSNGVEGLINYWLGPDAFGPFLDRYRNKGLEFTTRPSGPDNVTRR